MPSIMISPLLELDKTNDIEKEITIVLNDDGTLLAVHDDKLELESILGSYTISRASMREFNNKTQLWEATINGEVIASHKNKTQCDALECKYLNITDLQILEK